ncbi:MAG TPA: peptide-methionine (S)-S-oxide reductase MsrA, partial [bacterium]|nr:peptide-methionine (S)-S-oxide reductase MsrA [bacterium]
MSLLEHLPLLAWAVPAVLLAVLAAGRLLIQGTGGFFAPQEAEPTALPVPAQDMPAPGAGAVSQVAVLAGGCFWGVQGVFQRVKGVQQVLSGYAGGAAGTATYEAVCSGTTGHAESVQITFDPRQVTFGTLLRVFFSVAHDPTQLDRQGPDEGTQYRSAIFCTDAEQQRVAQAYIAQL